MLTVAARQRWPQAVGRDRVAPAHNPNEDAPPPAFDCQPKPYFALFAANVGPHPVEFKRIPAFFLGLLRTRTWWGRQLGFFARLATVMRETLVVCTMLRYELRSTMSFSTYA